MEIQEENRGNCARYNKHVRDAIGRIEILFLKVKKGLVTVNIRYTLNNMLQLLGTKKEKIFSRTIYADYN